MITHRRLRLASVSLCFLLCWSILSPLQSWAQLEDEGEPTVAPLEYAAANAAVIRRHKKLTKGINIGGWFRGEKTLNARHFQTYMTETKLREIKSRGFNHIRLTVSPKYVYNESEGKLKRDNLSYLDEAIRRTLRSGLAIVVDFHVVPSDGISDRVENRSGYLQRLANFWKEFARHMSKFDPEMVFFETMNEPMFLDVPKWYNYQRTILQKMREGAPQHTFIANSNNLQPGDKPGEPESLVVMTPYADPNIIYNFHYYDPMEFTHQGADWVPKYGSIKYLPYPSTPENCSAALKKISSTDARNRAKAYCEARWNAGKVDRDFKLAADWAKRYNVRVTVNEFGVLDAVAPSLSRANYMRDVRLSAEKYGFGWTVWAFDDNFGPTMYDWDDERWTWHPEMLRALGLSAGAKMTEDEEEERIEKKRQPKKGDNRAKLRTSSTTGTAIAASPAAEVRLNFEVENRYWNYAEPLYVRFEVSPQLEVGYSDFKETGAWVSQISDTFVEVSIPQVQQGKSFDAALIFRPSAKAKAGETATARYQVITKKGFLVAVSNVIRIKIVEDGEGTNDSDGSLLELDAPEASEADMLDLRGDFFSPEEPVGFWFTAPDGTNTELGLFYTDNEGNLSTSFKLDKFDKPGVYLVVCQGHYTGVIGVYRLEVKPPEAKE